MDIEKGEEFEQKQRAKPSLQVVRSYEDCLRGLGDMTFQQFPWIPLGGAGAHINATV